MALYEIRSRLKGSKEDLAILIVGGEKGAGDQCEVHNGCMNSKDVVSRCHISVHSAEIPKESEVKKLSKQKLSIKVPKSVCAIPFSDIVSREAPSPYTSPLNSTRSDPGHIGRLRVSCISWRMGA
jgi:hypothetical protein